MGKMDVLDLDISIAKYICNGLKMYIKENENAVFPTAPDYCFFEGLTENATLEERVKAWHILLNEIADKFNALSKVCDNASCDSEIELAFDLLKKVYKYLWI